MAQLILLRHGESIWNRDNRFTGWTDVDLSDAGLAEAHQAARRLRQHGLRPHRCFTSVLKRAIRTLWIVQDDMDLLWLPTEKSWRLNERHYGALQGLNKGEMAVKVGVEQVHLWRRGYAIRPPALDEGDPRHPDRDPRYAELPRNLLPRTESLKDTVERVLPYWRGTISPELRAGHTVLISAHGNSLRALMKHLDGVSEEEIPRLEIPTGVPLLYELDGSLNPLERRRLGSE